jgi:predicted neutral ceramidase superfamily lipid hydrolase
MKLFKRSGRLFISGMEIASFIYLLLLSIQVQTTFPSAKNIFSILIMGGLIGIFSGLLNIDDYRIELPIHFVVTFLIVLGMMFINGWVEWQSPSFWLAFGIEYLFGYGLAWLIIFLSGNLKVKRINQTLRKRNQSLKK